MTLAEMNDEFGAARTNKKEFLERMDQIIPWGKIVKLVQPFYIQRRARLDFEKGYRELHIY